MLKQDRKRQLRNANQYFTPEFAVEKAFSLIQVNKVKTLIDPAVGKGIFLKAASKKWRSAFFMGIDIDKVMIRTLKKMALPNVKGLVGDSLLDRTWENPEIKKITMNGGFDLAVGNPPFSSRFHRLSGPEYLFFYDLANINGKTMKSQAIEILFLELFIRLVRKGGIITIVLPNSILSNPQLRYVRAYILGRTKVLYIINLPASIFDGTSARTSILILKKYNIKQLSYKTQLIDLDRVGSVNQSITVNANLLIDRMDFDYHHKYASCQLSRLFASDRHVKKLEDFVTHCRSGNTLYGNDRKFIGKGLKFLHSTNITSIGIDYSRDEKFVEPGGVMDFKDAHPTIGNILIVRVGKGCLGRSAIVDSKKDIGVVSDCILMIRVKNISPYYIAILLKTRFGQDWIDLRKHGVTSSCINKSDITSLPVPLLNIRIQERVNKEYKKILSQYRRAITGTYDSMKIQIRLEALIDFTQSEIEKLLKL